jgi:NarL family two-component system sensor histidine kinase LiaS
MDQAEQLSRQAQAELGALIRELRPVSLSASGFIPALEEYALGWSQQTAVELELDVADIPDLDGEVEQALFRVTQEALANVSRHSQAKSVNIQLLRENSEILLSIRDNGIGFEVIQASDKGMGLPNMHERMLSVGGKLDIKSEPGKGTRILASYPLLEGD